MESAVSFSDLPGETSTTGASTPAASARPGRNRNQNRKRAAAKKTSGIDSISAGIDAIRVDDSEHSAPILAVQEKKKRMRPRKKKPKPSKTATGDLADSRDASTESLAQSPAGSSENVTQVEQNDRSTRKRNNRAVNRQKREDYPAHLPEKLWKSSDKFHEGIIRFHKSKRDLAFVSLPAFKNDVVIFGMFDQNRALDGDSIVLEVLGNATLNDLERVKNGSLLFAKNEKAIAPKIRPGDEVHPIARILAIKTRRPGTVYAGFLMHPGWRPGSNVKQVSRREAVRSLFFKPTDRRAPYFIVDIKTCPEDIQTNWSSYETKLFSCSFKKWTETSLFPYAGLQRMLGEAGEIVPETDAIVEDNSITDEPFSEEVRACLPQVPWSTPAEEISKRRDMRHECIFTIDPETAKDLDDALSCKQLPDGTFEVGVHIADVTHFIPPGNALDTEASQRATSNYFVQRVIPMLPATLCEDLCSLNPAVDRLSFSVVWKMDFEGNILHTWFGKTVMRSCIKMSYGHAQQLLNGASWDTVIPKDMKVIKSPEEILSSLRMLHSISVKTRARRFDHGALSINQPKLTFQLDTLGNPRSCSVYHIRDSNKLVEEYMLMANMSVARKISEVFPAESLLRCHPPPNEKTLESFLSYTKKVGLNIDFTTSGALQKSILAIGNESLRKLMQAILIRSMQRAKYFCTGEFEDDTSLWRHYALSVDHYTHFTSPIRRYADVIVHRLLQEALANEPKIDYQIGKVSEISARCNLKKEDARKAQDASANLFLCIFLKRIEEEMKQPIIVNATVMDFGQKSCDVYIAEFAMEKRVHFADCGLLSSVVSASQDSASVVWPAVMEGMPPFEDSKARQAKPKVTKVDISCEYRPGSANGTPQPLKIMDVVRVRLVVQRKTNLEVSALLLHPSKSSMPIYQPQTFDHAAGISTIVSPVIDND